MKTGGKPCLFPRGPRVLFIDDDPVFGAILTRVAHAGKIALDHITSSRAVDLRNVRKSYDLIVTDYDLGNVTGIQLIRSLEAWDQALPTILVSSYGEIPSLHLPASVLLTLHKCEGPQKILYAALRAYNGLIPT